MATGGENVNDVGVYNLPDLSPLCVFEVCSIIAASVTLSLASLGLVVASFCFDKFFEHHV